MTTVIAHEGNPRENSLVVTGTLDGAATLVLVFPQGPIFPPTVTTPVATVLGPTGKYMFSTDTDGNVTFTFPGDSVSVGKGWETEYSFRFGTPMCGFIGNCPIGPSTNTNLPVYLRNVLFDFYTMRQHQLRHFSGTTIPIRQTCLATLEAVVGEEVTGKGPIVGVAVLVKPASTPDEFYGLVGAYDWSSGTGYLMRYDGQPLTELGTILLSDTGSVVAGNTFSLQFNRYPLATPFVTDVSFSVGGISLSSTNLNVPEITEGVGAALVNIASSASHQGDNDEYVTLKNAYSTVETD